MKLKNRIGLFAVILISTAIIASIAPTSAAYITAVSPNGGENWAKTTVHTIKWTSDMGGYVKIELLKAGVYNSLITSSTANDGSHSWTIPSGQALGTDYKVRITSLSNPTIKDMSNNNFRISGCDPAYPGICIPPPPPDLDCSEIPYKNFVALSPDPHGFDADHDGIGCESGSYVTVLSPNGGEKWVKGTTNKIKWGFSNSGSNVKIELLKGGIFNSLIASSTANDGSYDWIPTQTVGTDYKIRITSTGNSAYKDISNNNFTISNPYLVVLIPNGGESWQRGTTKTITWKSYGNTGTNVKIDLYRGGVFKQTIVASTPNDGSHPWAIPIGQTLGTDYKIKITSASNSTYYDWSNNYFRIY